jgi:hypothetical protein
MSVDTVTEKDILEKLRMLSSEQWAQVLDFIGYLSQKATSEPPPAFARSPEEHVSPRGWDTYVRVADHVRRAWPEEQATQSLLDEVRR